MGTKRSWHTLLVTAVTISMLTLTQIMCGLFNSTKGPGDEASPPTSETSTRGQPSTGDVSLKLVNATEVDICTVAATVTGTNDHSENILEETLKPSGILSLIDLEPVSLDLVARNCDGEIINTAYETVLDGPVTWEITDVEVVVYEQPPPPPTSPDQIWLVMLYLDADDELIEEYINFSLNEAELVGSTEQVQIVAQLDRFEGGFAGDGDWTSAKRYYLTQDSDLSTIASDEQMDLGEVNMSDPDTLADFVVWSMETYPADKYVLILSDHGGGYTGGWSDQSASGDSLTLVELDSALAQIQSKTGLEQFELIGFEACLMSSLEVYTAIAPYARYSVASEEVSRAVTALPYAGFLTDLTNNPGMSGADLAESIVRNNVDGDAALAGAPGEIVEFLNSESTLAAVDLAMIPHLLASLDRLLIVASKADQDTIALARYYTQSYFSLFGRNVPPSFLDLGHLATVLVEESHGIDIYPASKQLLATLDQVVIAEKHGTARPGSTGITLYFPNSTLYGAYDMLPGSNVYSTLAGRFASESLWDDFLLYHYTGAPMPDQGSGTVVYAAKNAKIVAPGVGQIKIAPLTVSSEVLSMEKPIFVSTEISGGHIAQVFAFGGRYDEKTKTLIVEVYSILNAEEDKEVNGVVYPNWTAQAENGVVSLASDIHAESLVVTDGKSTAFATFTSEAYGEGNYFAVGTYTSVATGEQHSAILRFNIESTEMLNMYVLSTEGYPIEYAPQPEDKFTFTFTVINQETGETNYINGDTLTFGNQPFRLDVAPVPPGQYVLGITVLDLDGNAYNQFVTLTAK